MVKPFQHSSSKVTQWLDSVKVSPMKKTMDQGIVNRKLRKIRRKTKQKIRKIKLISFRW